MRQLYGVLMWVFGCASLFLAEYLVRHPNLYYMAHWVMIVIGGGLLALGMTIMIDRFGKR